jgi:hypothetical protein
VMMRSDERVCSTKLVPDDHSSRAILGQHDRRRS